MDGGLERENAKFGKVRGDICRDDIPKFLYDLAVEIDNSGVSYEDFVNNKADVVDLIVGKYLV